MKVLFKRILNESLFRNSAFLMSNTVVMAGFGFVFWVIVAHLYRPAQVGVASSLISAMNFIAYLSLLGFNSTFIRYLPKSKNRDQQIDTGLLLVALAAAVVSSAFVMLSPHFSAKFGLLHHTALYGLGFVFLCIGAAVNLVTDSIFIAFRSAGYNLLVDGFIGSGTQLLLPVFLVGLQAFGIYAAQGAAAFVAMTMSIILLMKRFQYRPSFKFNMSILRTVRRYSSTSYLTTLFNIIPTIVLPIIVLNRLGAAQAGYFYLSYMIANVLFTVTYAVAQSLFAEGSHNEQELRRLVKRAALLLASIMIPGSILLALLGPLLLDLFGKTYGVHSRHLILMLAAAGPFMAANALGSTILRVVKQLGVLVWVNVIYAATVFGVALIWANRGLAWVGGAWLAGQVVTAVVMVVALGWLYRRRLATARVPA